MQKVWLNGRKIFERSNIRYRYNNKHKIAKLALQNFHGGKSNNFKPGHTQYIWYVLLLQWPDDSESLHTS